MNTLNDTNKSELITCELWKELINVEIQYELRTMYKEETDIKNMIALAVLMTPFHDANDYLNLPEVQIYEKNKDLIDWNEIGQIIRDIRKKLNIVSPLD